jgi:hypothetical protein
MLTLVLLLTLIGLAGGIAVRFLIHAMRPQTTDDLAQLVCTAFEQQNYDLLTQRIDPRPVPPTATGAFDPTALRSQLKTLDSQAGDVTACDYQRLRYSTVSGASNKLQYAYTLRRAHTSGTLSMLIIIQSDGSGGYTISRASNFIAIAQ